MTIRSFALDGVRSARAGIACDHPGRSGVLSATVRDRAPGMARYLLALALLGALTSSPLAGQESGDFVRVSGNLTAQFIRSDSTGLYLSSGFVPYDDVTSLELLVGTRALEGLFKGIAIGAGVGLGLSSVGCLLLWITDEPSDQPREFTASGLCGITLVTVVPIGGLAGGVVGTVVGLASSRFTPIPLPTSRLGMSDGVGGRLGLTLGVRLRF